MWHPGGGNMPQIATHHKFRRCLGLSVKMANKKKTAPKWPKLPQNRPKNLGGCPRKSQLILKISELDDSPNARVVGKTCLRVQWCTSHRVTSHCAPFSRMCASTYEVHNPPMSPEAPTGHPKHPNALILGQSGT